MEKIDQWHFFFRIRDFFLLIYCFLLKNLLCDFSFISSFFMVEIIQILGNGFEFFQWSFCLLEFQNRHNILNQLVKLSNNKTSVENFRTVSQYFFVIHHPILHKTIVLINNSVNSNARLLTGSLTDRCEVFYVLWNFSTHKLSLHLL